VDFYQIIAERFQGTIESIAMAVDEMAGPIAQGSELMSQVLLQDGRILCCGTGPDAALSQLFCGYLLHNSEQERPALPVFDLSASTGIVACDEQSQLVASQVRALGQEGDLLLLIDSSRDGNSMSSTIRAARDQGMLIVAISCNENKALANVIEPGDAFIEVAADGRAQRIELSTMALHSLGQLIELSLFGDYNQD
jgi:D-sedoheptulose 7-phosphate isomerase